MTEGPTPERMALCRRTELHNSLITTTGDGRKFQTREVRIADGKREFVTVELIDTGPSFFDMMVKQLCANMQDHFEKLIIEAAVGPARTPGDRCAAAEEKAKKLEKLAQKTKNRRK